MSKTPNKKMIGLFSLVGIILFLGFMTIFLRDKLFVKDEELIVLYFDESVKGLSIGAPVVLRGVELGRVIHVKMLIDVENIVFKTPVYIKLDASQISRYNDPHNEVINRKEFLHKLIDKGLRGRLATQNFLTGQLMVELVMSPDDPAVYKGGKIHQEIPTVISSFGELSKSVQDLPVRESLEKFNTLLEQTSSLVTGLNKSVANSNNIGTLLENMNKTVREIGEAAQSLRNFADYIERHPEALLKGKKGY